MTQIILALTIISSCIAPPNVLDGYCDAWGDFVPGLITNETWMTGMPTHVEGKALFYGPYAMDATAEYRGIEYDDCLGGVSLMSPIDIGKKAWVKIDDIWYGPYCVVDCSRRGDMYTNVVYREDVIEINFELALEVGMVSEHKDGEYEVYEWFKWVEVLVDVSPEEYSFDSEPIYYKEYFLENLEFATEYEPSVILTLDGRWKEWGRNVYFPKKEYARPLTVQNNFVR